MLKNKKVFYIAVIFIVTLSCITSFNMFKEENRNKTAEQLRLDSYVKV